MENNMATSRNRGESNGMYKKDIGLSALHVYVARRLEKPSVCADCKAIPPRDLANKGVYDRDLKNWEWLCRRCHMLKDGRLARLPLAAVRRSAKIIRCAVCDIDTKNEGYQCCIQCYNRVRYYAKQCTSQTVNAMPVISVKQAIQKVKDRFGKNGDRKPRAYKINRWHR